MRKIVVMSRKGGAGKTTVAVNLALAAAGEGKRVVLADIDPQHSSSEALRSRKDASGLVIATTAAKLFALTMEAQRMGCDLMVIDTPPAPEEDVIAAIKCADLCVAVARPNFLDLAAVAHSIQLIRRFGGKGVVLLNQCPPGRAGQDSPSVIKALEALRYTGLPVSPVALGQRAAYQSALAQGVSLAEFGKDPKAADEIARLYDDVVNGRPEGEAIAVHSAVVYRPRSFTAQPLASATTH